MQYLGPLALLERQLGHSKMTAILPQGRYHIGDPGRALRPDLFQSFTNQLGDFSSGIARSDGRSIVILRAHSPQVFSPNRANGSNGMLQCQSGFIGLAHADLCVPESPALRTEGAFIDLPTQALVLTQDGELLVYGQSVASALAHIDTNPYRRTTAYADASLLLAA